VKSCTDLRGCNKIAKNLNEDVMFRRPRGNGRLRKKLTTRNNREEERAIAQHRSTTPIQTERILAGTAPVSREENTARGKDQLARGAAKGKKPGVCGTGRRAWGEGPSGGAKWGRGENTGGKDTSQGGRNLTIY